MAETKKAAVMRDLVRLKRMDRAMRETSPKMWKAQLEFLWDKYVTHADKTREALTGEGE